jgi:hypothetical protein
MRVSHHRLGTSPSVGGDPTKLAGQGTRAGGIILLIFVLIVRLGKHYTSPVVTRIHRPGISRVFAA